MKGELKQLLPERVVAYYNPASTLREKAKGYLIYSKDEFRRAGIEQVELTTEPNQSDMNESFLANVKEGDMVMTVSGDGGTSSVLEAALEHPDKPSVLAMPFGNGNDMAYMLNSPALLKKHPTQIIDHTEIAKLHPISVETKTPDGDERLVRAFAYWGVGATGRLAGHLCDPETREELDKIGKEQGDKKRYSTELDIAVSELRKQQLIAIKNGGRIKQLAELNFVNGRRESKTTLFPVRLFSDDIGVVEINNPSLRSSLMTVAKSLTGRVVVFDSDHRYEFSLTTDARTQKDGQIHDFPAGTEFIVKHDSEYASVCASENYTAMEYYRHKLVSIALSPFKY